MRFASGTGDGSHSRDARANAPRSKPLVFFRPGPPAYFPNNSSIKPPARGLKTPKKV